MKNLYLELRQKHQDEMNSFPIFFAFSQSQFKKGMEKLGLSEDDTDKIYSLGGGGYYRRTDAEALREMFERHEKERKENLSNEQYAYEMFLYELSNHEYCITFDLDETLDACDITLNMLNDNEMLAEALRRAEKDYLASCC